MRWLGGSVLLAVTLAAGCVHSDEVECADGRICPAGNSCDDILHTCISPEQIAACTGLAADTPCSTTTFMGECTAGACQPFVCGDGLRTGTEACDGSDFGSATCLDAGFYAPEGLACSQFCTFDTSGCTGGRCGDGILNGDELCDTVPPPGSCEDQGFDAGSLRCDSSCGASFEACGRFGWAPEVTGVGFGLAIVGKSSNDLWLAGFALDNTTGQLAHFDGVAWTVATINNFPIMSVTEAGSGDVWMIGQGTGSSEIFRLVAGIPDPVTDAPPAAYTDITAFAPDDVFVATRDAGLLHWDGASWHAVGAVGFPLTAARGTGDNDLFAITSAGAVEHWDGGAWSDTAFPGTAVMVDPLHPGDAWAIGFGDQFESIAVRWNGTSWTSTPGFDVDEGVGTIAASADNDVWVAGASGTVAHFDGFTWTQSGTPVTSQPTDSIVEILPFANEVVAASSAGFAFRYRGQFYGDSEIPALQTIVAVWPRTADDIYSGDTSGHVFHFDGVAWSTVFTEGSSGVSGISGTASDDVWLAFADGTIYHGGGSAWTLADFTFSGRTSVWAAGSNDVWFADSNLHHFDGATLTVSLARTDDQPCKLAGAAFGNVWAGCGTDLYHFDGFSWSAPVELPMVIGQLTAADAGHVFVTQSNNHVIAYDGTSFVDTGLPTDVVASITSTAIDDVFAASATELFHYDGAVWTPVRMPAIVASSIVVEAMAALPGQLDLAIEAEPRQVVEQLIRTRPWNCRPHETNCSDGVDDDCDGLVDGNDPDCTH